VFTGIELAGAASPVLINEEFLDMLLTFAKNNLVSKIIEISRFKLLANLRFSSALQIKMGTLFKHKQSHKFLII
jgi:hypothetical protein